MSRYYRIDIVVSFDSERLLSNEQVIAVENVLRDSNADIEFTSPSSPLKDFCWSGNVTLTGGMSEQDWHDVVLDDIRKVLPFAGLETQWWYEERDPDEVVRTAPLERESQL